MCGYAQLFVILLLGVSPSAFNAAEAAHPDDLMAPAPAPAPPTFENITQALVFGGNYFSFIDLLEETKVAVTFQDIANDTEGTGLTIFAPTDDAFKSKLVSSLLKNVTVSQKTTLAEYHALSTYQAFKDLQNSNDNVTSTFATFNAPTALSGRYRVNISFTGGGRLQIASGWTTAKISTTVYTKRPVSIYAIDQVLIPDELFGLPPPPPPPAPPPPAPSPAPSKAPPAIKLPSTRVPSSTTSLSLNHMHYCSGSWALLISVLLFHLFFVAGSSTDFSPQRNEAVPF